MTRPAEFQYLHTVALRTLKALVEEIDKERAHADACRKDLRATVEKISDLEAKAAQLRQDIHWLENPEPKLEMGHERHPPSGAEDDASQRDGQAGFAE
jgi:chromosome segregation ATPase